MRWWALFPGIGPALGPLTEGWSMAQSFGMGEPEIPTALDDWDEKFKEATGAYPPFSRLANSGLMAWQRQQREQLARGIAGSAIGRPIYLPREDPYVHILGPIPQDPIARAEWDKQKLLYQMGNLHALRKENVAG